MSKKFCGPTQAEVTDLENGAHSDQEVHRANSSTYSNGRQVRDLTNEFHEPTGRVSSRTWWICGFLFLATVLNYLDRQVLSLTADRIIGEFGLTKEGFGKIIAAFRYSYGIFQIFGGFL